MPPEANFQRAKESLLLHCLPYIGGVNRASGAQKREKSARSCVCSKLFDECVNYTGFSRRVARILRLSGSGLFIKSFISFKVYNEIAVLWRILEERKVWGLMRKFGERYFKSEFSIN